MRTSSSNNINHCLLAVAIALTWACPASAAEWKQFRGPDGQGHADAKNLPLRWSESDDVAWKTPIPGRGWSSPVFEGNTIEDSVKGALIGVFHSDATKTNKGRVYMTAGLKGNTVRWTAPFLSKLAQSDEAMLKLLGPEMFAIWKAHQSKPAP